MWLYVTPFSFLDKVNRRRIFELVLLGRENVRCSNQWEWRYLFTFAENHWHNQVRNWKQNISQHTNMNTRQQILLSVCAAICGACSNKQECSCQSNFEWVKKTIEENDAGYQYAIGKKGIEAYQQHNKIFRSKVKSISDKQECRQTLREWLRFFRKGHLYIYKKNADSLWLNHAKNMAFSLTQIDGNTLLLRIPTFAFKSAADSIINANKRKLMSTPNLIIDIRNNGGGGGGSFMSILPLLYTNPIRVHAVWYLSTPLNNARWLRYKQDAADKSGQDYYQQCYDKAQRHMGAFYNVWDDSIISRKYAVLPYPKHVGIIVDSGCASAAEQFVWEARQSGKVKIFGTATFGAYDISNMNFVPSPCGEFELGYGCSKNMLIDDMPIDDIGMQPDYYIDRSIPDSMWVDFVHKTISGQH
jgi:hypothetical protein